MATSCTPGVLSHIQEINGPSPSRTCGSLGCNDDSDPNCHAKKGDTPSSLGINDLATKDAPTIEVYTEDEILLAATAYGEGSLGDLYEELAAIANVIVRQRDARSTTLKSLLGPANTYAFAASNGGNDRYRALKNATPEKRQSNQGMKKALKAARSALTGGTDYADGAYFWDGIDIKTNYEGHAKVKVGIKFSKPEHNVLGIKEKVIKEVIVHWKIKDKNNNLINGKERGKYSYTYISTAGYGKTIFWKYSDEYLHATGAKPYL